MRLPGSKITGDNKVSFRVWAPLTVNVDVVGEFNNWQQIFCSQDSEYGGWEGAGNAFYDPYTQFDDYIYINIPKWSVLFFKLL